MTLDSITFPPLSGGQAKQMVVLVHGIADSGRGMMKLAQELRKALPDAVFVMPHAPYAYDLGPQGRQWFSMKEWIQKGTITLPTLMGEMEDSAEILNEFIDGKLQFHGLDDSKLAIVGYSQGASMTLFAAPRRANRIAGIVALSGRFVSEVFNNMANLRKSPLLAMHGDKDTVIEVASHSLLIRDMRKAGFIVQEEVLNNMGHVNNDPRQLAAVTAFLKNIFKLDQPKPAGPAPSP